MANAEVDELLTFKTMLRDLTVEHGFKQVGGASPDALTSRLHRSRSGLNDAFFGTRKVPWATVKEILELCEVDSRPWHSYHTWVETWLTTPPDQRHELPERPVVAATLSNLWDVMSAEVVVGRRHRYDIELSDLIAQHSLVVVTGELAVGKSEIVLQWAKEQRHPVRWWIDCSTPSKMQAGLVTLASKLGILSTNPRFTLLEQIADGITGLLILDGIRDEADLTQAKNATATTAAQIIATTTLLPLREDLVWLQVEPLDLDETRELVAVALPGLHPDQAAGLADALRGQPLAVWQAAHYIKETATSVIRYIDFLTSDPGEILERGIDRIPDRSPIAKIWRDSFELVRHYSGDDPVPALCILFLMGGSSRAISYGLWLGAVSFSLSETPGELASEVRSRDLVGKMAKLRLVRTESATLDNPPSETTVPNAELISIQAGHLLTHFAWSTATKATQEHSAGALLDLIEAFVPRMRLTSIFRGAALPA